MNIFTIVKNKSNIKGFWIDKNKIYIDNLKIVKYSNEIKQKLFSSNELAVFYFKDNRAYIEDKNGNIETLRNKKVLHYEHITCSFIKKLLSIYGGLTIYRNKTFKDYTIEIWSQ